MPSFDLDRVRNQGKQFFSGFTTAQKIATGVAIVAVLVAAFAFTRVSHDTAYTPLFTNLDATDASKITDALTSKGVQYELQDGGKTIAVPSEQVYQLRLDMSAQGLPSGGSGYALLDKEGITTSEFRQRVDYQRALQTELEKTVASMDGVQAASVHLVVPAQSVFADSSQAATASVLVKVDNGQPLSNSQVQSIVHLVASSVDGLKADAVTVADTSGNVLAAPGVQAGTTDTQSQQVSSYEQSVSDQVKAMLDKVVGPGAAVVAVQASLNFDTSTVTSETYSNPNTPANATPNAATAPLAQEQQTTTETLSGTGTAGTLGTTTATASTPSNYSKTDTTTKNALNHSVESTSTAPGQVTRQSVSVILDADKVDPAELQTLSAAISAAAGVQAARGDVINVTRMNFDKTTSKAAAASMTSSSASSSAGASSMLRTGGAILLVLIVLFLLWRSTRKASKRQIATRTPIDLAAIEAGSYGGTTAAGLAGEFGTGEFTGGEFTGGEYELAAGLTPTLALGATGSERTALRGEVADLVDRQPDDVALTLRSWLAESK